MLMDNIKKSFSYDNYEKLYKFFAEHSEYVCECCKNHIKCEGEKCPQYEVLGNKGYDESGNVFHWNRDLTCLDLNYGDCTKFENTICYDCINSETGYEGFDWTGEIKDK